MNNALTTAKDEKPPVFRRTPRPIRWLREVMGILLWLTAVIQVFVFDVIGSISTMLSVPSWLVTYRSLILLGLVIVLWLSLGNARFIRFFGYIILYPAVVICWHIPRSCFRYWPLLVAFSPAFVSFLQSFRFSLALYGLALISAFVIFLAPEHWQIISAMSILGLMLIVHYYRQMKTAFAAKTVFATTAEAVGAMWEKVKTSDTFIPPADIDPTTKEGKDKFGSSLIAMYLLTAGLGKVASAMRSVAESRKLDFFLILSWCITVCLTITVFAFLFLGLEKVAPGSFEHAAGFLSFLGYSLCVLTTSDLSHVHPLSDTARVMSFLELGGSISVLILMVFLILTSLRDRYRDDLTKVADELGTTAKQFEALLSDNYKLTMHAAEEWLLSYSRVVARHILRLRYEKEAIAALEAEIERKAPDSTKTA